MLCYVGIWFRTLDILRPLKYANQKHLSWACVTIGGIIHKSYRPVLPTRQRDCLTVSVLGWKQMEVLV